MRAIMKSIRPQHNCNILNLIKELEISTTAPKDWKDYLSGKTDKKPAPIEVCIYCTKDEDYDLFVENGKYEAYFRHNQKFHSKRLGQKPLNGKVLAKFTLNEVKEINSCWDDDARELVFFTDDCSYEDLLKKSCLTKEEIENYFKDKEDNVVGYAWHIDNLVPFDKPKEINEFHKPSWAEVRYKTMREKEAKQYRLTSAPQSWYYIEV